MKFKKKSNLIYFDEIHFDEINFDEINFDEVNGVETYNNNTQLNMSYFQTKLNNSELGTAQPQLVPHIVIFQWLGWCGGVGSWVVVELTLKLG